MNVNKTLTRKLVLTLFLIFVVFLSHTGSLDSLAGDYTEQGIKRTLITFAVARGLNGVISVAQGTEVAVSPAGVGLTFAPGQVLDPVNDLVERFSWVVMLSGTSLGIQRLFLEISSSPGVVWILSISIFIFLVFFWFKSRFNFSINGENILLKSIILMMFIRFSVPAVAFLNESLYLVFMQAQYTEAQVELETATQSIKTIQKKSRKDVSPEVDDSLVAQVEKWLDNTQQTLDVEGRLGAFKLAAENISQQVINMIVVFVVQTIIFPLIFLWLLIKSAKSIMRKFSV